MRKMIALALALFAGAAAAQTVTDSPELYPGEKALYEAASKEGMVVSFDTGPTWANWAAQFAAFKKRYPNVEMTYNDLGRRRTGRRRTPPTTSPLPPSMRRRRTSLRPSDRSTSTSCRKSSASPTASGSRSTR
jgi:hypothetical protein